MGYTRFWETTKNRYNSKTIDVVRNIIQTAKDDFDITIRSGDGSDEPIINEQFISINGDGYNDLDHESFVIINGEADGLNFCKTARKPYDIVINAILQYLNNEGIVNNVRSDGSNMEKHAKILLEKALSPAENKYILEAYDKDNDVYWQILHTHTLEDAKTLAKEMIDHDWTLYMPSGEPIDWFVITDETTKEPIKYFNMYDKIWKSFLSPQ